MDGGKFAGDEKIIVWTHWPDSFGPLKPLLAREGIQYAELCGNSENQQSEAIKNFKEDPHKRVLLVSS